MKTKVPKAARPRLFHLFLQTRVRLREQGNYDEIKRLHQAAQSWDTLQQYLINKNGGKK